MKKLLITTAIVAAISTPVFAGGIGNTYNNQQYGGSGGNASQGQAQGQLQGQSQNSKNHNKNTNSNKNDNFNSNKSTSVSGAMAGSSADNANAVSNSVTVEGDNINIPEIANSASAPALVAAEDTCMGSTSVGGQGFSFGFSGGTTWRDEDCVRRKDARELNAMGLKKAAVSRMCQKEENRQALLAEGIKCGKPVSEEQTNIARHGGIEGSTNRR